MINRLFFLFLTFAITFCNPTKHDAPEKSPTDASQLIEEGALEPSFDFKKHTSFLPSEGITKAVEDVITRNMQQVQRPCLSL